jgi:hypothetical protein
MLESHRFANPLRDTEQHGVDASTIEGLHVAEHPRPHHLIAKRVERNGEAVKPILEEVAGM